MRHALSLLLLLLLPVMVKAQAEVLLQKLHIDSTRVGNRILQADSLLTDRYQHKGNYDTAYIARPAYAFTVRVRGTFSGSGISAKGTWNGTNFNSHLAPPNRITTSFGISYRGLSVGVSINPEKLAGRDKNNEYHLSAYANRYGVEALYQDARHYSGWVEGGGGRAELPADMSSSKLFGLNAYYVFNHRRFSYPAAFTQSYIQLRSQGSWMLALSLQGGEIRARHDEVLRNPDFVLRMGFLAVGGGYGYNWVLPHRWLIHASVLPTLIVASLNRMAVNDVQEKMPNGFPNMIITERGAVIHELGDRHFLGLTFSMNHTLLGGREKLNLGYNKWRVRICYGFRF